MLWFFLIDHSQVCDFCHLFPILLHQTTSGNLRSLAFMSPSTRSSSLLGALVGVGVVVTIGAEGGFSPGRTDTLVGLLASERSRSVSRLIRCQSFRALSGF